MIGTWLARELRSRGDQVVILTRRRARASGEVQWDPSRRVKDLAKLEDLDAVVNLTGAPIADRPWTKARQDVLWHSRIDATEVLLEQLGRLEAPPRVFIGVGGLGYYGDRGDEELDETMRPGTGFLADLSVAWEQAHLASEDLGCRAAVLRMSIVLSPTGGAFPLMVKPFRMGIGGWLGNGRQYTPWISIRDAVAALIFLLDHDSRGPYNGTVPDPTVNKEWVKALGRVLHRPVLTHAPKWALRGALGELADELLIASVRAVPARLQAEGFRFMDWDAEATYRWLLQEMESGSP